MNTNLARKAALVAASVPAAGLALVAGFSQNLYAGSQCFDPRLELFTQPSPVTSTSTGVAGARVQPKPPFILMGAAFAKGYLNCDSGVTASNAMVSVSRLWTTTCPDWSYGWAAKGSVVGQLKAKSSKTWPGSATASCSFSATASGDLNPAAHDAKAASSSTQAGGSVTMTLGVAPPAASYSIGQTSMSQTVGSSTNPSGDSKTLYNGPQVNVGAGFQTIVVVSLSQEHNCSALGGAGGASMFGTYKSDASTGGYAGAAITQDLYAAGPWGLSTGISVFPGTQIYRWAKKDKQWGSVPEYGPWKPPHGDEFEESGPKVKWVDEPPPPPSDEERKPDDESFRKGK